MLAQKEAVADYWERESCGTGVAEAAKHSRDYFEEIEAFRYRTEPEIHAFAQFTRHYGQRMLEVGVGAGSDFIQWVRAGTQAHGIDLTAEGIENVRHRLRVYGLTAADLRQADAENLPYPDNHFDLVYSWGVIHHSPDTERCLSEIARVVKPGGTVKVMVYNRRSLLAFYWWLRYGPLAGKPFRSIADVMAHHMESPGTKAFTRDEFAAMAERCGLTVESVDTTASPFYDLLSTRRFPVPWVGYGLGCICGISRCGWFLRLKAIKRQ